MWRSEFYERLWICFGIIYCRQNKNALSVYLVCIFWMNEQLKLWLAIKSFRFQLKIVINQENNWVYYIPFYRYGNILLMSYGKIQVFTKKYRRIMWVDFMCLYTYFINSQNYMCGFLLLASVIFFITHEN